MNETPVEKDVESKEKWDFSDYAYTITGIIVGVLLVGPEILTAVLEALSGFEVDFIGDRFGDIGISFADAFADDIELQDWGFSQLRALSPLLFMLTTAIVYFHEAFEVRKTGEYKGLMFTHTFESLLEEAIYFAITTIMLYGAILFGAMFVSWLAGPIAWILFIVIFPLVRKKNADVNKTGIPWLLLAIFALGIIGEVLTGIWVAFPLSWLVICAFSFVSAFRSFDGSADSAFDILYYAFSVILMVVGIFLGSWIASWSALLLALFVCWILHKFGRFKKVKSD